MTLSLARAALALSPTQLGLLAKLSAMNLAELPQMQRYATAAPPPAPDPSASSAPGPVVALDDDGMGGERAPASPSVSRDGAAPPACFLTLQLAVRSGYSRTNMSCLSPPFAFCCLPASLPRCLAVSLPPCRRCRRWSCACSRQMTARALCNQHTYSFAAEARATARAARGRA